MILIVAAGIGGGILLVVLIATIVIAIRSRGVKWVDSIGVNFLTSKKNGSISIVQDIITLENKVTYESFVKTWSAMLNISSICT